MSFVDELERWPFDRVAGLLRSATLSDVGKALEAPRLSPENLAALLSPCATDRFEEIAQATSRETRRQFGRTIRLYAPIYLSNFCEADCLYCGFAARSGVALRRKTLTEAEIRRECEALASHGFKTVLIVTGEAPRRVPVDYLSRAVEIALDFFPSVSVETYSLAEEGYRKLVELGLEGVTLYMETYDRDTYQRVHRGGAKAKYERRLSAIEVAGRAGVRSLGIGSLLGLFGWRVDGFWTALHARYLQKACWGSAISISFPRLRHVPGRYDIPHSVTDAGLAQLMLSLRLFLPEVGFNLSTREPPELRDNLMPLGVTMMSAGSSTRPGGYAVSGAETLEQFEIEDHRTPAEVAEAIRRAGYDPVWKDFDHALAGPQTANRPGREEARGREPR